MDLRTLEEQRRDAVVIELVNLCEASKLLAAFEVLGIEHPAALVALARELHLPDTEQAMIYLQARLDDLVRLNQVTREGQGLYKVNPQKRRSELWKD